METSLYINTVEDFDKLETAMLSSERQVAEKLHIKPCTLRNERLQGAISFVKIRARYYYTDEQIEEYIRSKTIPSSKTATSRLPQAPKVPDRKTNSAAPIDDLRREAELRHAREIFRRGPRSPHYRPPE